MTASRPVKLARPELLIQVLRYTNDQPYTETTDADADEASTDRACGAGSGGDNFNDANYQFAGKATFPCFSPALALGFVARGLKF